MPAQLLDSFSPLSCEGLQGWREAGRRGGMRAEGVRLQRARVPSRGASQAPRRLAGVAEEAARPPPPTCLSNSVSAGMFGAWQRGGGAVECLCFLP